ncbi:MAG TPA: TolC family protein [Syntrophorhabdaceae bacterium]|nr:TolC family protein [Syntrophorhabdaceae bacterium]
MRSDLTCLRTSPLNPNSQSGIKDVSQFSRQLGTLLAFLLLLFLLLPLPASAQAITPGTELTLEQAIDTALRIQPSILAGRFTVKANEATIGQAQANYYPQIAASGSYSKIYPGANNSGIDTPGKYDQYTSTVGLNQTIFDFGKTPTQVTISSLNTESSRFDLNNLLDTVVFNVKQAFYNVLQAQRNRDVAAESVKQFQQHLDQAQGFYNVGTRARIDVTKAEVDLSNARLNLIKAENQIRLSRVTLNNAMGISGSPEYTLKDNLFYVKYGLAFEDALSRVYAQRSDLQSLIKKGEAAKASIDLARKGYLPVLSGNANYNYSGTNFPLTDNWSYGVNLSVPLFTGFYTKYQVAQAQANYDALKANEQSLRLDIYSQVQQGYLTLREAEERIGTSELTVKQATENVDLATGRYQAGVGSPLEVTDALVNLSNAQVAYTQALTDCKNAQATIEKAIGVR